MFEKSRFDYKRIVHKIVRTEPEIYGVRPIRDQAIESRFDCRQTLKLGTLIV